MNSFSDPPAIAVVIRRLRHILLSLILLISIAPELAKSDAAGLYQTVARDLLDGRVSDALETIDQWLARQGEAHAADDARALRADIQALTEVDRYALEGLRQRIGQALRLPRPGGPDTVDLLGVEPSGAFHIRYDRGGAARTETLTLEDVSALHKLPWLSGMPPTARSLHATLLAWEMGQRQPFERHVVNTGPIGPALWNLAMAPSIEAAGPGTTDAPDARTWETFDEDAITRIRCDVISPAPRVAAFTNVPEANPANAEQTEGFHYNLYIPKGYNSHPDRWYPVMFIAAPSGNAGMGQMARRLKRDEWVVVMLVESRNRDPRWVNNFLAAHDDVMQRVRIAPGAKFATGLSGGARVSSVMPSVRPGFSGVILQAAGMVWGLPNDLQAERFMRQYPPQVAVAITAGDADRNAAETYQLRMRLNRESPLRVELWEGGHAWAPADVFDRAMDWMEQVTFLDAPRPARDSTYFESTGTEELHPSAYEWFYRITERRAEDARDSYERYFHLARLPQIAANGRLTQDRSFAPRLQAVQQNLAALQQDPVVRQSVAVERAYQAFWDAYAEYERIVSRMTGNPFLRGYEHRYGNRETRAAREAIAAGEHVIERFPQTPQAAFLQQFLPGIEIELRLWGG